MQKLVICYFPQNQNHTPCKIVCCFYENVEFWLRDFKEKLAEVHLIQKEYYVKEAAWRDNKPKELRNKNPKNPKSTKVTDKFNVAFDKWTKLKPVYPGKFDQFSFCGHKFYFHDFYIYGSDTYVLPIVTELEDWFQSKVGKL